MREVAVRSRGVSPAVLDALSPVLRTHATLQHVLEWCQSQKPPRDLEDVVVQDEFTHDVVLEVGDGVHAVYDTT